MRRATYVGPVDHLRGKTALVIDDPTQCTNPPKEPVPAGHVLAQFDERETRIYVRGDDLSLNWHAFPAASFRFNEAP